MKLYNSMGPNPQMVRMYAAELGIELSLEEVDLMAGENRQSPYLSKNTSGQTPALELDDGTIIAEITAICEYLDDITDGKTLIGDTPQERAVTHMWTRRVDLNISEPMGNGFRYAEGLQIFENRMITLPEAADGLKRITQSKLAWLDEQMSDGREFIAGKQSHDGRHLAVQHDRLLLWCRPTVKSRQYPRAGLVRPNGCTAERSGLIHKLCKDDPCVDGLARARTDK